MVLPFLRRLLGASEASTPGGEMGGEPTDPVGVTYPIRPTELGDGAPDGPGGDASIGLLRPTEEASSGGIWAPDPTGDVGITYPIRPTEDGGEGSAGSFFDRPGDPSELAGIREPAIDPDSGQGPDWGGSGAVSIGPKHEDPTPPPPESMSSTVGGPGGGEGPDWGGSGAVSIGPKHEDPSPPPPESMSSTVGGPGGGDGPGGDVGTMSIGPNLDDPSSLGGDASASTVVDPGGGGPGDVGMAMEDEGPSTLMDSEGGGIFLQGDQAPELGDLASGADMDLEGTLEP